MMCEAFALYCASIGLLMTPLERVKQKVTNCDQNEAILHSGINKDSRNHIRLFRLQSGRLPTTAKHKI